MKYICKQMNPAYQESPLSRDRDMWDDMYNRLYLVPADHCIDIALLELEADASEVVVPLYETGKVRAPKALVIREVPLEEAGIMGKILAKRGGVMMPEYIELNAVVCIADYAADEHPYEKDPANPETFSEYNQGWNDACDYIRNRLESSKLAAAPGLWCGVKTVDIGTLQK